MPLKPEPQKPLRAGAAAVGGAVGGGADAAPAHLHGRRGAGHLPPRRHGRRPGL